MDDPFDFDQIISTYSTNNNLIIASAVIGGVLLAVILTLIIISVILFKRVNELKKEIRQKPLPRDAAPVLDYQQRLPRYPTTPTEHSNYGFQNQEPPRSAIEPMNLGRPNLMRPPSHLEPPFKGNNPTGNPLAHSPSRLNQAFANRYGQNDNSHY